jgi:hypothetical protein
VNDLFRQNLVALLTSGNYDTRPIWFRRRRGSGQKRERQERQYLDAINHSFTIISVRLDGKFSGPILNEKFRPDRFRQQFAR